MLDVHGEDRTRAREAGKPRIKKGVSAKVRSFTPDSSERIQWTVKGIDKETLELSRREARKRGMKFGAWVNEVLRTAAQDELLIAGGPRDLLTKMAELEFKLIELKDSSANIQHDVRILQALVSKSA